MSGTQNSFINSVMRVVISTPNLSQQPAHEYERTVIEPTQKVLRWADIMGDSEPEPGLALEILRTLRDIMDAKGISLDEQRDHVNDLLRKHGLTTSCGHFLAEMFATKFARV